MDVNAPKEEINKVMNSDSNEIFQMEEDTCSVKTTSSCHNIAHTLDICMDKMFNYIIQECHNPDGSVRWEQTKGTLNFFFILNFYCYLIL